jgi:RNA-directed DNA polymerase
MSASSSDPEKAELERRKAEREERLRVARLERAEARRARLAAWEGRLAREIVHAGVGVSGRLAHTASDEAELARRRLPLLKDAADVAAFLGVDVRALRWLTYHREVASVTHYRQFEVPKAKGGVRTISAPRPRLRAALQVVRTKLVDLLPVTEQAHAFVPGRSTVSNAKAHLQPTVLVKIDIRDFFGTIEFPRVRGLFEHLGYSGMVATLLGLLCTEARRVEADLDGRKAWVAVGPRSLPQGAPTSPALTNQIARRLDARLTGWCKKSGWTYTRYADDLTFSLHAAEPDGAVQRLLGTVRAILEGEGFAMNPKKLAVIRRGRQQRVTGVVVNHTPGVDRREARRFRAAVHRVTTKGGFESAAERRRMLGWAAYVAMVKPALGKGWLAALKAAPSHRPDAGSGA